MKVMTSEILPMASPTTYLFIYLYFSFANIYNKKHKNIVIYTTHYIQIAMQMLFNKQICMQVYVNQSNGKKNKLLKNKLKY